MAPHSPAFDERQLVRQGTVSLCRPEIRISIFGLADSDVGRIVAMPQESKAPDVELTIHTSKRHIVKRKILFQ